MIPESWDVVIKPILNIIPPFTPPPDDLPLNFSHTSQDRADTVQKKREEIEDKIKDNSDTPEKNEVTGTIDNNPNNLYAWDPRLSRVDGYMVTGDESKENPVIIPFASNTAASSYFNMVFSIERGVYDAVKNADSSSESTTQSGNSDGNTTTSTSPNQAAAARIAPNKTAVTQLKSDGNMYGVASIVNPYTLTKLCGSLQVSNEGELTANKLYDVRDTRRFYDVAVETTDDFTSISNPTTTNIITWSNRDPWGRTPYSFQDFVFCKYWNIVPNNRLITFRKYHAPVYDNLQFPDMYTSDGKPNVGENGTVFAPIATVLSYFGEQTGNTLSSLMTFTTGTKWKEIKSDLYTVDGNTGDDPRATIDDMFTNGGGFSGAESNILKNIMGSANWVTGKMFSFGKFMGLLDKDGYNINQDQATFEKVDQANIDPQDQLYSNRIMGPVNRIDTTKARDAGIVFEQKFTLTCEYIARPIGGVNTKAAMLDILSNCMEIASPDAAFWGGGYKWMIKPHMYPFKNNRFKNDIMDALYKGKIFGSDGALAKTVQGVKSLGDPNGTGSFDWSNITSQLKNVLGEGLGAIGSLLSSVGSAIFGDGNLFSTAVDKVTGAVATDEQKESGSAKLNNLLGNVNQMWRSKVIQRSIMPAVNNMKALLTGEPVGNWHLVVGNPLNPIMTIGNLICTQMTVTCSDELGPDDFPMEIKVTYSIEHAMPREKGSIQSMFNRGNGKIYDLPDYMRASSDYESKVDNFTGNTSDAGWVNPQFMGVGAMLGKNGGSGGYKTYKLSPPKKLSISQNTDNTVIAKFTPVDPNMATEKLDNDLTFFGSNNNSRAWIRGTAATRKLMN